MTLTRRLLAPGWYRAALGIAHVYVFGRQYVVHGLTIPILANGSKRDRVRAKPRRCDQEVACPARLDGDGVNVLHALCFDGEPLNRHDEAA